MGLNYKHIDKIGRIVVDSLLLILLWLILALPISTFSLISYAPADTNVLSGQDVRPAPEISPDDPTKTYRDSPSDVSPVVFPAHDYLPVEETSPSSDINPLIK